MRLPKLFKQTSTEAAQEWQIFVDGEYYYTISGQVEGKKIKSAYTRCVRKNVGKKNETSPQEQAELEAQSKWQKKVDAGYVESLADIKSAKQQRISPMLAKSYEDYSDDVRFPVFSQPKLDGIRVIVTREGAFSRLGKSFATLDHIREAVAPIFELHPNLLAFDGEIYSHELKDNFERIVSLVKQPKASKEDIERCKQHLQYHIYDAIHSGKLMFRTRTHLVGKYISLIDQSSLNYFKCVETSYVKDQDQLDGIFNEYLQNGYEGQMIRNADSDYQQKRTKDLLKRKVFNDAEYNIIGYKEGKGGRENCIVLRLALDNGGEFDSVPVGPIEYLKRLWEIRDRLVGLKATVKYQNLSSEGVPRFNNTIKIKDKNNQEFCVQY